MSSKKMVFVSKDCPINDIEQRRLSANLANLEKQRQKSLRNISHEIHSFKSDYTKMRQETLRNRVSDSKVNQIQDRQLQKKPKWQSSVPPPCSKVGHKCSSVSKCNHSSDSAVDKISEQVKNMERMLQTAAHSSDPEVIQSKLDKARRIVLNLRSAREKRLSATKTSRACSHHTLQTDRVLCAIKDGVKLSTPTLANKPNPALSRYSSQTSTKSATLSRGSSATRAKKAPSLTKTKDKETSLNSTKKLPNNPSTSGVISNNPSKKKVGRSKSAPSGSRRNRSAPAADATPDAWLAPDVSGIELQDRDKAHAREMPLQDTFNALNFDSLEDYMVFGVDGLRLTDLEGDARGFCRQTDTQPHGRKQYAALATQTRAVSPYVNDRPDPRRPHTAVAGQGSIRRSPAVEDRKTKPQSQRKEAVNLRENVTPTCRACTDGSDDAIARMEKNMMDSKEKVQRFLAGLHSHA